MTRQDYEAAITGHVDLLTEGIAQLLRDASPLPESAYNDAAIIDYAGITLICGGDYSEPCDEWAGGFDVCSVRVEDSRTDIFELFNAAQIRTIEAKCYWSIRNDTLNALDATR